MNTKNIKGEIDLYSIAMIIFKNKLKLFLIVIIGIILSIIHEKNQKPFTPIYEISLEFEEISLLNQQKYDELNNNLQLTSSFPAYLKEFESKLDLVTLRRDSGTSQVMDQDFRSKMMKDVLISKYFDTEKKFIKYENIDSKLLLSFFIRFLADELDSQNYSEKIKELEIIETPLAQSNIGDFRNAHIKIRLLSDDGDIEAWEKFFQNKTIKTNENVRNYLYNKLIMDIDNVKKNYNYFLNELSTFGELGTELKNISNKLFDRQFYYLNNSPLSDIKIFTSAKLKNNSIKMKIANQSKKKFKIEIKIFISILLSLLVGVILILLGSALKKQ